MSLLSSIFGCTSTAHVYLIYREYLVSVWVFEAKLKVLNYYYIFQIYFLPIKKKTILQFLTDANNSEILENNGRLDIIRIT